MDIGLGIVVGGANEPSPRNNLKTPSIFSSGSDFNKLASRKKKDVEQMSIEELRMNKKLLNEIAQKKKENSA